MEKNRIFISLAFIGLFFLNFYYFVLLWYEYIGLRFIKSLTFLTSTSLIFAGVLNGKSSFLNSLSCVTFFTFFLFYDWYHLLLFIFQFLIIISKLEIKLLYLLISSIFWFMFSFFIIDITKLHSVTWLLFSKEVFSNYLTICFFMSPLFIYYIKKMVINLFI